MTEERTVINTLRYRTETLFVRTGKNFIICIRNRYGETNTEEQKNFISAKIVKAVLSRRNVANVRETESFA